MIDFINELKSEAFVKRYIFISEEKLQRVEFRKKVMDILLNPVSTKYACGVFDNKIYCYVNLDERKYASKAFVQSFEIMNIKVYSVKNSEGALLEYMRTDTSLDSNFDSNDNTKYSKLNQTLKDVALQNKTLIDASFDFPYKLMSNYVRFKTNLEVFWNDAARNYYNDCAYPRCCIWIWGRPGIGKTRYVTKHYKLNELYRKDPYNKWWDNYTFSCKAVLMDDVDRCVTAGKRSKNIELLTFSYYLKIYSDNYLFNAEVKGSNITPFYSHLYITSNYHPENILNYDDDIRLKQAILRRFTIIKIDDECDFDYVNYMVRKIEIARKIQSVSVKSILCNEIKLNHSVNSIFNIKTK